MSENSPSIMWMFKNTRLGYWHLLHRCYLGVPSLSFSTHSRILFSSEYFHYKTFVISTSCGTPRKCSRYPRVPRNPGWESLAWTNARKDMSEHDYILITNLMHWLLFIHKILFSSTCFETQVLNLLEDTVVYMQHMVLSLSMRVRGDL